MDDGEHSRHHSNVLPTLRPGALSNMYAVILLGFLATFFYGARAEDEVPTTLELMEQSPEALHIIQPKFLAETNARARQQFEAIIADKSLTIAQMGDKLNKWAAEQGGQIESGFQEAKEKLHSILSNVKGAIKTSSLSDSAKQAFSRVGEIAADKNEPMEEQEQQIEAIMASLPDDVRDEMKNFVKSEVHDAFAKMKSETH